MKWQYKGQRLAPPITIIRRLIALPILRLAQCLVFASIWFGWGIDDAKDFWVSKE